MKGLRSIVALSRDSLRGVEVIEIEGEIPSVEWVDPRSLFVEEDYQRDVRENGTAMIRRIVGRFSWHRFKPPVCFRSAEAGDALVVVDGQHTAIAAATRGIGSIPVLVVSAATVTERAMAFVGHNRDRLGLTMQSVFFAEIAAGDALARSMRDACEVAGAKIIPHAISLARPTPVGETMAVGTIRAVAKRHGAEHLTRVMSVLVAAKRGPIKAQEIGAVSTILLDGNIGTDRLAALIGSKPAKNWEALCVSEAGTLPQRLAALWARSLRAASSPKPEQIVVSTPKPAAAPGNFPKKSESSKAGAPAGASGLQKPPPQVKRIPEPAPAPKPPGPAPAATILAEANGIIVTAAGAIVRKGHSGGVNVGDRGAQMLSRLVRVMPAMIDMERMAQTLFRGDFEARRSTDRLVSDQINPTIAALGLEVFIVKGSGYMLRDRVN